jgi:hypothetical protein
VRADFGVLFLFEDYHHDIAVFKVNDDVTAAKGAGRLYHH